MFVSLIFSTDKRRRKEKKRVVVGVFPISEASAQYFAALSLSYDRGLNDLKLRLPFRPDLLTDLSPV